MTENRNHLHVLGDLAEDNKVALAMHTRITNARAIGRPVNRTRITIEIAGNLVGKLAAGDMVGCLVLADRREFNARARA